MPVFAIGDKPKPSRPLGEIRTEIVRHSAPPKRLSRALTKYASTPEIVRRQLMSGTGHGGPRGSRLYDSEHKRDMYASAQARHFAYMLSYMLHDFLTTYRDELIQHCREKV